MSSQMHAQLQFAALPLVLPDDPAARPAHIAREEPAIEAMVDFRCAPLATVRTGASIEEALQLMKHAGTAFAFVVGAERQLVGAITAHDIQGEKPVRYMLSAGSPQATLAWRDVLVGNIMEPVENWHVLEMAQVQRANAGEIADLLAESRLRHVVVIEAAGGGARQVRGLFSAARLQELLGGAAWTPEVPRGMTSVMAGGADAGQSAPRESPSYA